MAAPLVKTKTPGIYKRGSRYVFSYRDHAGKQRWESCRTLEEARRAKSARATTVSRGESLPSSVTLNEYAVKWAAAYQGRKNELRESTKRDYQRIIESYVTEFFSDRVRITSLKVADVDRFAAWLRDRGLSDKSVRNYVGPLSACLESARRDGIIDHNPAKGYVLPARATIEEDDEREVRALTTEQLTAFLMIVDRRQRLFFEVLASTGLRVSEAIALQWRHVHLDGDRPHVKVRRGIVRGVVGAPKSKYSRRDVPLPRTVVDGLRASHKTTEWPGDEHLVFPNLAGQPMNVSNLRNRTLKPAAAEAGAAWMGFHTLRHTCASRLFAAGRNAVQVQHWLGHHSAAFTLSRYVHLLDGDLGDALEMPNFVQTSGTPLDTTTVPAETLDMAA